MARGGISGQDVEWVGVQILDNYFHDENIVEALHI